VCRMKDGAGGQRGLMVAAVTLVEPPGQPAAGGIATVGAHEPLGPAMLEEGGLALRFRAVLLIGIGGSHEAPPLPHHPACGSAPGGSRS